MASILRKAERQLAGQRKGQPYYRGGSQYTKSRVERERERHEARVLGRPMPHGYLDHLAGIILGAAAGIRRLVGRRGI